MTWINATLWTDERVDLLKKLWDEGLSCSQIAKKLASGHSRNAVIGKVHRMGWPGRAPPSRPARLQRAAAVRVKAPPKPPKPRLVIAGAGVVMQVPQAPPPKIVVPKDAFEVLPGSTPKLWSERDFGECTWPVGKATGADTECCCNPVKSRGWCDVHFELGTAPEPRRSAKHAARSLRRYAAA